MSDRKPSPFPILLNNDICSLIEAAENVYQVRFKNRGANAYLVRGKSRTIMIDVGLSSNYPSLLECLHHLDCPPEKIDIVVLSHEHLDHIGAAWHFGGRTLIAAHRLAANKIMLRDDFSMLRKMFNEPNVPINVDIWLEEGNLIDIGDFRLDVMHTPGHTSACISLFDQNRGLLFAADTLFSIGCGRVFEGTYPMMWESLLKLRALPDDFKLYCGHEYTAANIKFALTIEPDNPALKARAEEVKRLRAENKPTVPTLLGEEKKANVFLRADEPSVAAGVRMKDRSAAEVFGELRERKNKS